MNSESETISAVLDGDRDRFRELIDQHQKMVYGVAWSHLGNLDLTEEAVQETFVKAFRYLATLKDRAKFSGWLATIARNISLGLRRTRKRELAKHVQWDVNLLSQGEAPSQQEAKSISPSEQLCETLQDLSDTHREALTLFYLEGHDVQSLMAILDLSESAVKTRLHRARQALRDEMEKKLGDALEGLHPSPKTTSAIMAILPMAPIGVGGGLGLAGQVGAAIAKFNASILMHIWTMFAQFIPFSILMTWFSNQQAENIVDAPEQQYRKTLWKQHAITVIVMVVTVGSASYLLTDRFGFEIVFQAISVYTLFGLWMVSKLLKVNRSRYAKAQVLTLAIMFVCCVLVGFFSLPPFTFIGGMIVVNLIYASAHQELPQRMDYNIFLRAATGGLRDEKVETERVDRTLTAAQLKAFARLMGELWLVRDYDLGPGGITLRIPPAKNSFSDMILSTGFSRGSFLHISSEGQCTAEVDRKDLNDIERLQGEPIASKEIIASVVQSVESSLQLFRAGQTEEARETLCKIPDEQIFKDKDNSTKSYKKLAYISVGAAIVSFTLFALIQVFMTNH